MGVSIALGGIWGTITGSHPRPSPIIVGVVLVELLYFERDYLEAEVSAVESSVEDTLPGLGD